MRVYFGSWFSRGVNRVTFQLEKYMPDDFVLADDPDSADLEVIHINGRHDKNVRKAKEALANGRKYAVIQYVLQSCRNPNPEEWADLWDDAQVVWSYYDLKKWIPNFYHAPLAATDKFYKEDVEKKYLIGTMGVEPKSECFNEARLACYVAGGRMLHVGKKFAEDPIIDFVQDVSDDELRILYNQCEWFSVLRRADGFEIIGLEALQCGVRPIMFDTPNYRQWYGDFSKFIPEKSVGETVRDLTKVLQGEPSIVTDKEIEEIKRRFDWKTIIDGFWNKCRS
jgi:hypothetical protein